MFKHLFAALIALFFAAAAYAAVDANTGTQAELESVKGIGPAISAKIIDERKKGNFKDWEDLVGRVKGVGEKNSAKLSTGGLTVNGASFAGAPAAPAKAAATTTAATKTAAATATPATPVATATAPATPPAAAASSAAEKKAAAKQAREDKKAEKAAKAASAAPGSNAAMTTVNKASQLQTK
jgi:competence protein ComEA